MERRGFLGLLAAAVGFRPEPASVFIGVDLAQRADYSAWVREGLWVKANPGVSLQYVRAQLAEELTR